MSAIILRDLNTRRFLVKFGTNALAALGVAWMLIELTEGITPINLAWWASWALVAIGVAIAAARAWPRPIEESYSRPNTKISIVEGDMFDQDPNSHLVIGTCDTFDTRTPHIIATKSLQGQALHRLYGGDCERLDTDLAAGLRMESPLETITKKGNTVRYNIGTVAVIDQPTRKLFFLAYTRMSLENNAQGDIDGVWVSLRSLWKKVSEHGNGNTVCVPVIGTGLSRLSGVLPAQDSIRMMLLSFMFASRDKPVCDELRIVVHPGEFRNLDRLELQAFLTSLKPS